jgi:hypothetical protein
LPLTYNRDWSFMNQLALILLTLIISLPAYSACEEYRKIHGLINLEKKSWETTHVNKKSVKVCDALPLPPTANIEVSFTKGSKKLSTQIYRPLKGHWDMKAQNKNFDGGTYKIKHLPIETFAPAWFSGSKLEVRELPSKRIIVETTL